MLKRIITLLFIFIFSICVFAQKANNETSKQIIDVNFCDLLKNPNEYKDKVLRVKATYISFFEASKIYCSDCLQRRGTWVEFNSDLEEITKKIYRKRLNNNSIVNVIFVGKFYTGQTYGHQNGYDSQFIVEYIENAEVVSKKLTEKLPEEAQAKTNCQTKN